MISKYPPETNLALWRQLPLLAFREEKRTLIAEAVVSHGLEQCEAWLGRTEHTLGLLQHLVGNVSVKGTCRHGLDELVYEKHFKTVCYQMHMVRKMF